MEPVIFHIDVNSAFLSWTAIEQLKNGSTVDLRTIRPLSAETARAVTGSYWQSLLLQKRLVSKPANRSHMLFENANPWLSHVRIVRCTVSIPSSL